MHFITSFNITIKSNINSYVETYNVILLLFMPINQWSRGHPFSLYAEIRKNLTLLPVCKYSFYSHSLAFECFIQYTLP